MISTKVSRHINAPRASVYHALTDPTTAATWMVPDGATGFLHTFEPREGGVFRITLAQDPAVESGMAASKTDSFHGLFVRLVPEEEVVQLVEFETTDPALRGEMHVSITLADSESGGTDLLVVHDRLPPGLLPADCEARWRKSLAKLATLVEQIVQYA